MAVPLAPATPTAQTPAPVPLAPVTLAGDIRAGRRPARGARRVRRPRVRLDRSWFVLGAAVLLFALWLLSLRGFSAAGGLLHAAPPLWFVVFGGTVLLYVTVLLSRRPVGHQLAGCQVVLTAVLTGTAAAVSAPPSSAFTAVVERFVAHGLPGRSAELWSNFPAVPSAVALLHRVTGVPVADLARWAPPVVALLTAAAVYWLVGGLSSDRRVRYGAVLLVTLGDRVGGSALSPQALAFPLSLVVLGGLLRSVPRGPDGVRWAALRQLTTGIDDDDLPTGSPFWASRWGAAVLVVLFALVVVGHPVVPVVLLAGCAVVCALLRPARPWLVLLLLAVEEAWLLPAWPFLSRTYRLADLAPRTSLGSALPGQDVASWAGPLLTAAVALLGAWGFAAALLWRDRAGRVVVPAVLALVAVVPVLARPYGEARAYLFALPLLAFLAALELFDDRRDRSTERRLLTGAAVLLVALLALAATG